MKVWRVLFIAGALLLLLSVLLASAYTENEHERSTERRQNNVIGHGSDRLERQAVLSNATKETAPRTKRAAKKGPIIQLKCALALDVVRKIGFECSKDQCPNGTVCRPYHGSNFTFCLCEKMHIIYYKAGKVCVDLRKPCEQAKLLGLCHKKAACLSDGLDKGLYYCKCQKGFTGNGATCQRRRNKGVKGEEIDVQSELWPTVYTATKKKMKKKPNGDAKEGEITVGELYNKTKGIVLQHMMLIAAGAAVFFIIFISCCCYCRKRRRKQATKKQLQMRFEEAQLMHQPFQQDPHFGQFDQPAYGMDPGYGQPYYNEQTAMHPMGGEFYDYPMNNMGGPFAAAPAPPPPPPPPGPKPAQGTKAASGGVLESKSSFLSDEE